MASATCATHATTTAFYRLTRRSSVQRIVGEQYLRDDIGCGVSGCPLCAPFAEASAAAGLLSPDAATVTVLDTNFVLAQTDLLERPQGLRNVVVPSTVLAEVRHRSPAAYARLRRVIADTRRRFHVFANENHRECRVERLPGESPNDRNDRAIRVAAKWYASHLASAATSSSSQQQQQQRRAPAVVLLSDDRANSQGAREDGLQAFTARAYVARFLAKEHPELADVVVHAEGSAAAARLTAGFGFGGFAEHRPPAALRAGVKAGALHEGTLHVSGANCLEATVVSHATGKEILLQGRELLNRAVEGDVVAVELLPEAEWRRESALIVETDAQEEAAEAEARQAPQQRADGKVKPTGRVVGILRRGWKPLCGSVDVPESAQLLPANATADPVTLFFHPTDRRYPRVRIQTCQAAILAGKRVVVGIDGWEKNALFPRGHFIKELGQIGEVEAETEAVLLTHDIPHRAWNEAEMHCLPRMPWTFDASRDMETGGYGEPRSDLRDRLVCSVDPPGCKDIDDALHCKRLPNGNFEVGVHIADVTYFVCENTPLDTEAMQRCTSVYLADRRIDMLPKPLTEDVCSLRSGVDRLTFSVIWEMTADAQPVGKPRFCKSVIHSRHSFEYSEAQGWIDDKKRTDELADSLRNLMALARRLNQRRLEAGALVLGSNEIRFSKDENYHPVDIELCDHSETHMMVEEWMLAANVAVAREILAQFPQCAVLRAHPAPDPDRFQGLQRLLAAKGIRTLDITDSKALGTSLDAAVDPADPEINQLVRMLATRCLRQARYISSGMVASPLDYRHYGLAMDTYTHFTSPIRRYADILVHRLLACAIGVEPVSSRFVKQTMAKICDTMNRRHTMAQFAGRASGEMHTGLLFKGRVLEETAYVSRVRKNGFLVWVPKYAIESTVQVTAAGMLLGDGTTAGPGAFVLDEEAQTLSSQDLGVVVRVLDKIRVRITVDEKNPAQGITLACIHPLIPSEQPQPKGKRATPTTSPMKRARSPKPKKQKK